MFRSSECQCEPTLTLLNQPAQCVSVHWRLRPLRTLPATSLVSGVTLQPAAPFITPALHSAEIVIYGHVQLDFTHELHEREQIQMDNKDVAGTGSTGSDPPAARSKAETCTRSIWDFPFLLSKISL